MQEEKSSPAPRPPLEWQPRTSHLVWSSCLPPASWPLTHLMGSLQEAHKGPSVSTDPASSPLPFASPSPGLLSGPRPLPPIKINIHLPGFPPRASPSQGSLNPGFLPLGFLLIVLFLLLTEEGVVARGGGNTAGLVQLFPQQPGAALETR